mgnify:CR=1 FL=1
MVDKLKEHVPSSLLTQEQIQILTLIDGVRSCARLSELTQRALEDIIQDVVHLQELGILELCEPAPFTVDDLPSVTFPPASFDTTISSESLELSAPVSADGDALLTGDGSNEELPNMYAPISSDSAEGLEPAEGDEDFEYDSFSEDELYSDDSYLSDEKSESSEVNVWHSPSIDGLQKATGSWDMVEGTESVEISWLDSSMQPDSIPDSTESIESIEPVQHTLHNEPIHMEDALGDTLEAVETIKSIEARRAAAFARANASAEHSTVEEASAEEPIDDDFDDFGEEFGVIRPAKSSQDSNALSTDDPGTDYAFDEPSAIVVEPGEDIAENTSDTSTSGERPWLDGTSERALSNVGLESSSGELANDMQVIRVAEGSESMEVTWSDAGDVSSDTETASAQGENGLEWMDDEEIRSSDSIEVSWGKDSLSSKASFDGPEDPLAGEGEDMPWLAKEEQKVEPTDSLEVAWIDQDQTLETPRVTSDADVMPWREEGDEPETADTAVPSQENALQASWLDSDREYESDETDGVLPELADTISFETAEEVSEELFSESLAREDTEKSSESMETDAFFPSDADAETMDLYAPGVAQSTPSLEQVSAHSETVDFSDENLPSPESMPLRNIASASTEVKEAGDSESGESDSARKARSGEGRSKNSMLLERLRKRAGTSRKKRPQRDSQERTKKESPERAQEDSSDRIQSDAPDMSPAGVSGYHRIKLPPRRAASEGGPPRPRRRRRKPRKSEDEALQKSKETQAEVEPVVEPPLESIEKISSSQELREVAPAESQYQMEHPASGVEFLSVVQSQERLPSIDGISALPEDEPSEEAQEVEELTHLFEDEEGLEEPEEEIVGSIPGLPGVNLQSKSGDLHSAEYFDVMLGERLEGLLTDEVSIQAAKTLTALTYVTRSLQLYDARSNKVHDALIRFYGAMESFLSKNGNFSLEVHPWELTYEGECVYRNSDREHSLAYTFFRTGIRRIVFKVGISWGELSRFIQNVCIRYHHIHSNEDDLVTLLWKEDFSHIDILVKGPEETSLEFDDVGLLDRSVHWENVLSLDEEDLRPILSMIRPSSFRFRALDDNEVTALREENNSDYMPYRAKQLILYVKSEVAGPNASIPVSLFQSLLFEYLDFLMTEGRLKEVYQLLNKTKQWANESPGGQKSAFADMHKTLISSFEEPQRMRRLLDPVRFVEESGKESVEPIILQILGILEGDYTELLFDLLEVEKHQHLKKSIRAVLVELAGRKTSLFAKRMADASETFLRDLLYCLHAIRDEAALEALTSQIKHTSLQIQDLVLALIDDLIWEEQEKVAIRQVIKHLVSSRDPEIRKRALKLIAVSREPRWATVLLRHLKESQDKTLKERKLIAQLAAELNPEVTEPVLIELSEGGRGVQGATDLASSLQAAAIAGLAVIPSPKSQEAIEFAMSHLSPDMLAFCEQELQAIQRNIEDPQQPSFHDELGSFRAFGESSIASNEGWYAPGLMIQSVFEARPLQKVEPDELELEIHSIQLELMKALQSTGTSSNNEFVAQVREAGHVFVQLFQALLLSAKHAVHDELSFTQALEDFSILLDKLQEELGEVSLGCMNGQFYLNDLHVLGKHEVIESAEELYDALERLEVGCVTFALPIALDALSHFVKLLAKTHAKEEPGSLAELQNAIRHLGFAQQVRLDAYYPFGASSHGEVMQVGGTYASQTVYREAVRAIDEIFAIAYAGGIPRTCEIRRFCSKFVDLVIDSQEHLPLEFLVMGGERNPLHAHSLRVAVYTLLIGEALGLSKIELVDLLVAAVFHDLGYVAQPPDAKLPSGLSHTSSGLRALVQQRGFQDAKLKRLMVTFDHHFEMSPKQGPPPTLFSRIIRIADAYDLMTQPLHDTTPMPPPYALKYLMGGAEKFFDDRLVQLCINTFGNYPCGTLLALSDGSQGISLGHDGSPENFDRPKVLIVRSPKGEVQNGPVVALDSLAKEELKVKKVLVPDQSIVIKDILAENLRVRIIR